MLEHKTRYAIDPGRVANTPRSLASPMTTSCVPRSRAIEPIISAGWPRTTNCSQTRVPDSCSASVLSAGTSRSHAHVLGLLDKRLPLSGNLQWCEDMRQRQRRGPSL